MFYRRNTAAVAAVLAVLLSAVLLVCAPRPYSGHVWLELVMVVVCGVALGRAGVGLQSKPDASLPVLLLAIGHTPDTLKVACSKRFSYTEYTHFD